MQWISVEDKLPEKKSSVLCFEITYGMFVAIYERKLAHYDPGYFDTWNSGLCCGSDSPDPTHWMPLPKPPEN